MGLHLDRGLRTLARPCGEFGRTGPCQRRGAGTVTARHTRMGRCGGVLAVDAQSAEREPVSAGQSAGQGEGVVRLTEAAWNRWGSGFGWQWRLSRRRWSSGGRRQPMRVLGAPRSRGRGEVKLKRKNSGL
jgi:hypothetical protein